MLCTDPKYIPQWLGAIETFMDDYSWQYGGARDAMGQLEVICSNVAYQHDPIEKMNTLNEIVEEYGFTDNLDWSWHFNNAKGGNNE